MSFDSQLFSAAIQARLRSSKLSLRDAAKKSGVSASTLSRLTNGEMLPDIETFDAVTAWLVVDANVFLHRSSGSMTETERLTWLLSCLQDLDVPEDVIQAIVTLVQHVVKSEVSA